MMCHHETISRFPTFFPHTSHAEDAGCRTDTVIDILTLLNGFVMHWSDSITLEELQVNQILSGSEIMKLKNNLPNFFFVHYLLW